MFTGDNKDKVPGDLGFNPMGLKFGDKLRLNEIKVCSTTRSVLPRSCVCAQTMALTL